MKLTLRARGVEKDEPFSSLKASRLGETGHSIVAAGLHAQAFSSLKASRLGETNYWAKEPPRIINFQFSQGESFG